VVGIVYSFISRSGSPSVPRAMGRIVNAQATAAEIDYRELARNTEDYVDQALYYEGEVIQVIEQQGIYVLMVSVTDDLDNVLLVCNCPLRPLEDDQIAFVGTVDGRQSYKSLLGETITLPRLTATAIEIVQ
jgi:hypothetical protein